MEKAISSLFNRLLIGVKGPLLFVLLVRIIVLLVRNPPGRLFHKSAPIPR